MTKIIAHRGASEVAPENTAAAIEAAIDGGADVVEIDVQRSRDGRLVNFHDCTIDRTTDIAWRRRGEPGLSVSDLDLAELRQLDVGSWFDVAYGDARILTLQEVIAQVRGRVGLLVEISPCPHYVGTGLADQIVAELLAEPGYVDEALDQDQLWVQSFNPDDGRRVRALLPAVPVGLLTRERPTPEEIADASGWAQQINPPCESVDGDLIEAVHAAGITLNCWTVNDVADADRLSLLGVDGMITDHPERLHRAATPVQNHRSEL